MEMDVIVTSTNEGKTWNLTDLLGRSMGCIEKISDKHFNIRPAGHALETTVAVAHGHYASLDAVLAEIEKHTRGVCRRDPGKTQQ